MQKDGLELQASTEEYEQFVGILLLMGIVHMPSIRMYWALDTRFPPIADLMSRNRFLSLLKYFHVSDNTTAKDRNDPEYDKLMKIRPLLNEVRSNMQNLPPEEYNSVDEQIIPFKGRHTLKHYIPIYIRNKPHKWGFKCFTRSGASGLMYDFEIYVGKDTCHDYGLGFSSNIVLALCEILPKNKNFKVAFDNWFSSLDLAAKLKEWGILCVGSIRADRMGNPPLASQEDLKCVGRGAYDYTVEEKTNTCLVRWYDSKAVNVLSMYCAVEPVGLCSRWSQAESMRVQVPRPNVVKEYNNYMGGVDLSDMLIELYRINIQSRKWYMRIFFWTLGICISNAWLLYRRHQDQLSLQPQLKLLQFQNDIANSLAKSGKHVEKKRGRPSPGATPRPKKKAPTTPVPNQDIRFDNTSHWPVFEVKQQRCRLCKGGFTKVVSSKCEVSLCFTGKNNCFRKFHTK